MKMFEVFAVDRKINESLRNPFHIFNHAKSYVALMAQYAASTLIASAIFTAAIMTVINAKSSPSLMFRICPAYCTFSALIIKLTVVPFSIYPVFLKSQSLYFFLPSVGVSILQDGVGIIFWVTVSFLAFQLGRLSIYSVTIFGDISISIGSDTARTSGAVAIPTYRCFIEACDRLRLPLKGAIYASTYLARGRVNSWTGYAITSAIPALSAISIGSSAMNTVFAYWFEYFTNSAKFMGYSFGRGHDSLLTANGIRPRWQPLTPSFYYSGAIYA